MMENLKNLLNMDDEEENEILMVPDKNNQNVLVPQKKDEEEEPKTVTDFDALCTYQKTILEKTQTVLDSALEIAVLTQDPRAVTAAADMIKALAGVSESLAKLLLKQEELELKREGLKLKRESLKTKKSGNTSDHQTVNNNAIFIGTTAELQKELLSKFMKKLEEKATDEENKIKE